VPVTRHFAIALRAATLDERLALAGEIAAAHASTRDSSSPASSTASDTPSPATATLHTWQQAFAPGDPDAFERRLSWDGLTAADIRRALATDPASAPSADTFAAWTVWIDRFTAQARTPTHSNVDGDTEADITEDVDGNVDAPTLAACVAAAARAELDATPDAPADALPRAVRDALTTDLVRDVRALAGAKADERTTDLLTLFTAFPVLARHLAHLAQCHVVATRELIVRLNRDRDALRAHLFGGRDPGRPIDITLAMSDPHHGRRRVALLRFSSGLRVIYKPRNVDLERAYHDLLTWFAAAGLHPAPFGPRVVERDDYGWVEVIDPEPLSTTDEASSYFQAAGALLCLAWLFGGRDLHMENVIATRHGPVLIDTEMLLQPAGTSLLDTAGTADLVREDAGLPRDSCLDTGLLTLLRAGADGVIADIGGLRGDPRTSDAAARAPHLPYLDGRALRPEAFSGDVLVGFTRAYWLALERRDVLLAPDGPLAALARCRTRLVFRPSEQYASVHQILSSPRFQQSGLTRSCALDSLNRVFNTERARPPLWPLVSDERQALESLDIPRFTLPVTGTRVGRESTGRDEDAATIFALSGLDAARARISRLSQDDLRRQSGHVSDALESSPRARFICATPEDPRRAHAAGGSASNGSASGVSASAGSGSSGSGSSGSVSSGSASRASYVAHASWIGHELLRRAVPYADGLTWPLSRFRPDESHREDARYTLYEGAPGAALLFAALHAETREPEWADAARAALGPLRAWVDRQTDERRPGAHDLGICSGVGSIVYSLSVIGRLLDQDAPLELAERVAIRISAERVARDRALDVAGGVAGLLLALQAVDRQDARPALLRLASLCADRLLDAQVDRGDGAAAWRVLDGCCHAGFAHGAAGIAYALLRFAARTGRDECRDAALRALLFERRLFSPQRDEWPVLDATSGPRPRLSAWMTAWCHGAPGIALSRALSIPLLPDAAEDESTQSHLRTALDATLRKRATLFEHVCCGNAGRAEILLTIGDRLKRPELIAAAQGMMDAAIARARTRGHFTLSASGGEYRIADPGFFQGLSGIGYTLLRLAAPARLPSVLAFDEHAPDSPRATTPRERPARASIQE